MAHKRKIIGLLVGVMLAAGIQINAQTEDAPPVVISRYDIYTAQDGEYTQLTTYPYNSNVVTSPDGRYATYNSIPQVGIAAIERTGGFSGPMVENIWIIDTSNGDAHRIAGQPVPAYFMEENLTSNVIARSESSWSRDGTGVAWTDFFFEDNHIQLGIYDLSTNSYESFPIYLADQGYGVPNAIPVNWLSHGIALITYSYAPDTDNVQTLKVYTDYGALMASNPIPTINETGPYVKLYTHYQGRDYYTQYNAENNSWDMMDILTGVLYETATMPELVNVNNPNGSIRLRLVEMRTIESTSGGQAVHYMVGEIVDANGTVLLGDYPTGSLELNGSPNFYISPDGQDFIHTPYNERTRAREDGFIVRHDGQETVYGDPSADSFLQMVAWGKQMWRMPDSAELTQVTETPIYYCAHILAPRLTVGKTAIVLPGGSNRIRADTTIKGDVLGEIPPDATFNVIGPPTCFDGFVWWLVEYRGIIGWTAEGSDEYFVAPVE